MEDKENESGENLNPTLETDKDAPDTEGVAGEPEPSGDAQSEPKPEPLTNHVVTALGA